MKKKIAVVVLIFIAVLIAFIAFYGIQAQPGGFALTETYINTADNYEIDYPEGWEVAQLESDVIFIQAPEIDGFNASVGIVVGEEKPEYLNYTEEQFFNESRDDFNDLTIQYYGKTSFFMPEDSIEVEYTYLGDFGLMYQKQYMFNYNNNLYNIMFIALESNYFDYEDIFESMAASFRFIDGNTAAGETAAQ